MKFEKENLNEKNNEQNYITSRIINSENNFTNGKYNKRIHKTIEHNKQ